MNAGNRQKVSIRRPAVACWHCKRRFQVGLAFWTPDRVISPLSATFVDRSTRYMSHTLNSGSGGTAMIGRALGTVWWACGCRQARKSALNRKSSQISCSECGQAYFVALIFYRVPKGTKRDIRTPLDWTLPVWDLDD